jgi:hypothetical protein
MTPTRAMRATRPHLDAIHRPLRAVFFQTWSGPMTDADLHLHRNGACPALGADATLAASPPVVQTVEDAAIARRVARLWPLLTIKG